jgi:hypothetical protein
MKVHILVRHRDRTVSIAGVFSSRKAAESRKSLLDQRADAVFLFSDSRGNGSWRGLQSNTACVEAFRAMNAALVASGGQALAEITDWIDPSDYDGIFQIEEREVEDMTDLLDRWCNFAVALGVDPDHDLIVATKKVLKP